MISVKKDKYFTVNAFGISAVEVLWGLGLPVIIESTFLQLFLKSLGASNQTIGLIPAIMGTGIAIFSLMSAYLTSHLVHKRRAVILSHILTSIPIFTFGVILFITGQTPYTITLFLLFYVLGSLGLGLTIPIWQNFIVKIFSESRTIPAISIMMLSQTAAKLAGSFLILRYVEQFSFSPRSASIVFIILGILFFTGSFFFLFVKEVQSDEDLIEKDAHSIMTLLQAVIDIIHNKKFMLYLLATVEAFTCITIISFYANYAVEYHSISRSLAAGMFVGFIYAAGIIMNILFGWFNFLSLKNKLIISRISALCAIAVLLTANSITGFLATSFLLGSSRSLSSLCFSPAVKKLSCSNDATDYFAVSQAITLPFSFGIPFASGYFLDSFSNLGIHSYTILFSICGLLVLISLACIVLIDFS